MKMKKKMTLLAGVLASSMALSPITAVAEPNRVDVDRVLNLAGSYNIDGLVAYVRANPEVLEGETDIARALRSFITAVEEMRLNDLYSFNWSRYASAIITSALLY